MKPLTKEKSDLNVASKCQMATGYFCDCSDKNEHCGAENSCLAKLLPNNNKMQRV